MFVKPRLENIHSYGLEQRFLSPHLHLCCCCEVLHLALVLLSGDTPCVCGVGAVVVVKCYTWCL